MLDSQNLGLATLFSGGDTAVTGYSCYSGIRRHIGQYLNFKHSKLLSTHFPSRRHPSEFGGESARRPPLPTVLYVILHINNSIFMQNQFKMIF